MYLKIETGCLAQADKSSFNIFTIDQGTQHKHNLDYIVEGYLPIQNL